MLTNTPQHLLIQPTSLTAACLHAEHSTHKCNAHAHTHTHTCELAPLTPARSPHRNAAGCMHTGPCSSSHKCLCWCEGWPRCENNRHTHVQLEVPSACLSMRWQVHGMLERAHRWMSVVHATRRPRAHSCSPLQMLRADTHPSAFGSAGGLVGTGERPLRGLSMRTEGRWVPCGPHNITQA